MEAWGGRKGKLRVSYFDDTAAVLQYYCCRTWPGKAKVANFPVNEEQPDPNLRDTAGQCAAGGGQSYTYCCCRTYVEYLLCHVWQQIRSVVLTTFAQRSHATSILQSAHYSSTPALTEGCTLQQYQDYDRVGGRRWVRVDLYNLSLLLSQVFRRYV